MEAQQFLLKQTSIFDDQNLIIRCSNRTLNELWNSPDDTNLLLMWTELRPNWTVFNLNSFGYLRGSKAVSARQKVYTTEGTLVTVIWTSGRSNSCWERTLSGQKLDLSSRRVQRKSFSENHLETRFSLWNQRWQGSQTSVLWPKFMKISVDARYLLHGISQKEQTILIVGQILFPIHRAESSLTDCLRAKRFWPKCAVTHSRWAHQN